MPLKEILASVRHFEELPSEVLDEICLVAQKGHYNAGQLIYLEGEPAEALHILESGWVKATRMAPNGREQAMLVLKPGEIFGDVAVFSDIPYPGTVVALEAVKVWIIHKPVMLKLVARYPELALAIIRRLSERVLYFIGLVEDLSLRDVEARLANTLLKHVVVRDGRLVVPRQAWTTFDEMAIRLGTVRDVLSRALRTLESEGLLRVERHEILILDPEGLNARGN